MIKMYVSYILLFCTFLLCANCAKGNSILVAKNSADIARGAPVICLGMLAGKVADVKAINKNGQIEEVISVKWNNKFHFKFPMCFQIISSNNDACLSHIELIPLRIESDFFMEIYPITYLGYSFSGNIRDTIKFYIRNYYPATIAIDSISKFNCCFFFEDELPRKSNIIKNTFKIKKHGDPFELCDTLNISQIKASFF